MNEPLLNAILRHPSVPTIPAFALHVIELCGRDDASQPEVAALVQMDAATSLCLLRLANSPMFGEGRVVASLPAAVSVLGLRSVMTVTLATALMQSLEESRSRQNWQDVWTGSLINALAARRLSVDLRGVSPDEAFIAGLVMDVGIFVLREARGQEYDQLLREAADSDGDIALLERERLGLCHADVSAALLADWSLPSRLVEAVRDHTVVELGPVETWTASDRLSTLADVLRVAECYRRVFQSPTRSRIAELALRSRVLLGCGEESTIENLSHIEMHLGEVAQALAVTIDDPQTFAAARVTATDRLLEITLTAQNFTAPSIRYGPKGPLADRRKAHEGLTVLRVRVDKLERLRERYGERVHGEIVNSVLAQLRIRLRKTDMVMQWKRDGFLVLAPSCYDEGARLLAQGLLQAVQKDAAPTADGPIPVTISIGCAWDRQQQGSDFSELLYLAEERATLAVERGGNRFEEETLEASPKS